MAKAMDKLTIKDVFDKERDPLRDLNLIIKVSDSSSINIWVEFEEFIITETILDILIQFYNDFTASIEFEGPKMPFWLEGFYGSGKSHFSKLIGLLFQNIPLKSPDDREWNAIDFFNEKVLGETQFDDNRYESKKLDLIESLKLYPKQFKTKTIFINLSQYSKSERKFDDLMESFMIALLKEFNKSIGLAESIEIAEIEKNLIREGIYDKFKELIKNQQEEEWTVVRDSGPWAHRSFIKAYGELTECSEIVAQAYINGADSDCQQKNIKKVLVEMNKWAKKNLSDVDNGITPRILVVLDEAGIFFSAKASRVGEMMATAEWINTSENNPCINMIFNAQQSIETYIQSVLNQQSIHPYIKEVKDRIDFKTAGQRFKKWFLDKKNIKQVVVKRWLKKDAINEGKILSTLINNEYHKIVDGSILDTIKDPKFEYSKPTRDDIIDTYPFLPYQFPLMIQITQKLISEKSVEEQYGGHSRSILGMTREILHYPLHRKNLPHFVDTKLGSFVTLPQVYDSVVFILQNKEEDQFLLVEKSNELIEASFPEINKREREIPYSFTDVMKIILLMKYVEEVYCSDQNIAKGLYDNLSCNKDLLFDKVKKLIDILKRKGFISYHKQEIEDEKGNKNPVWEYEIASIDERKYIEKTHLIPINDEDVKKRVENFFKSGDGKDIINFRPQIFINKLFDDLNMEYSLSHPVKIKCNYVLDPDFDAIEGKILDPDSDQAYITILTPFTFSKWKNNLKALEKKIQLITIKALKKNKIATFISPSFTITMDSIEEEVTSLDRSFRECISIDETLKKESNSIPGDVNLSFQQRVKDIENDVKEQILNLLNNGFITYGKQKKIRISKTNINEKISDVLKEIFSSINKYAYLGQVKPSSAQVATILKWDKKKKSSIPGILKKSDKPNTENLFLFDEEGNDLQPNLAEQTNHINRELQKEFSQIEENSFVSGNKIWKIFADAPFSWAPQTTLAVIAALIRNNEYDVQIGWKIYNPDDKEILQAFESSSKNYEKFRDLLFKTAEKISNDDLNVVKDILKELFSSHITKTGPDSLDEEIVKNSNELVENFNEISKDLQTLELSEGYGGKIESIYQNMKEIADLNRPILRIKAMLEKFNSVLADSKLKKDFIYSKQILYRIFELHDSKEINRYFNTDEFNEKIMRDWLSTHSQRSDIETLKQIRSEISQNIRKVEYLFTNKWTQLWKEEKTLWDAYWNQYTQVHNSLLKTISEKEKELKKHANFGNLSKIELQSLTQIFTCKEQLNIPTSIENKIFTCNGCNSSHSSLELYAMRIKTVYDELWNKLEKIEIKPEGPKEPDRPILPPTGLIKPPEGEDDDGGAISTKDKWNRALIQLNKNGMQDVVGRLTELIDEENINPKYSAVLTQLYDHKLYDLLFVETSAKKYSAEEIINANKDKIRGKIRISSIEDYPELADNPVDLKNDYIWAYEIVPITDERVKPKLQDILLRTVVVEDKSAREKFQQTYGKIFTIITLDGDYQCAGGDIIAG